MYSGVTALSLSIVFTFSATAVIGAPDFLASSINLCLSVNLESTCSLIASSISFKDLIFVISSSGKTPLALNSAAKLE